MFRTLTIAAIMTATAIMAPAANALDFGSLSGSPQIPAPAFPANTATEFFPAAGTMEQGRYIWQSDCTGNPADDKWVRTDDVCNDGYNVRIMNVDAYGNMSWMSAQPAFPQ